MALSEIAHNYIKQPRFTDSHTPSDWLAQHATGPTAITAPNSNTDGLTHYMQLTEQGLYAIPLAQRIQPNPLRAWVIYRSTADTTLLMKMPKQWVSSGASTLPASGDWTAVAIDVKEFDPSKNDDNGDPIPDDALPEVEISVNSGGPATFDLAHIRIDYRPSSLPATTETAALVELFDGATADVPAVDCTELDPVGVPGIDYEWLGTAYDSVSERKPIAPAPYVPPTNGGTGTGGSGTGTGGSGTGGTGGSGTGGTGGSGTGGTGGSGTGTVSRQVTGQTVADYLARGTETEFVKQADLLVKEIELLARAYTWRRGWDPATGHPSEEIGAVIVLATARLLANPEQIAYSVGSISQNGGFKGWSLAELSVLNRYRQRSQ